MVSDSSVSILGNAAARAMNQSWITSKLHYSDSLDNMRWYKVLRMYDRLITNWYGKILATVLKDRNGLVLSSTL